MIWKRWRVYWGDEQEGDCKEFYTKRGAFNFAFEDARTNECKMLEVMKRDIWKKYECWDHVQIIYTAHYQNEVASGRIKHD